MSEFNKIEPIEKIDFQCSQCGSRMHSVMGCEDFDFLHGSEADSGREMVFARRQARAYGGIPEMYLSNPTPEQASVSHAFVAERKRRVKAAVLETLSKSAFFSGSRGGR